MRERHYDPIVEDGPPQAVEMPPLRGIAAGVPGTYVLVGDVRAALLRMAELEHHPEARAALLAAAGWFGEADYPPNGGDAAHEPQAPPAAPPAPEQAIYDPLPQPPARAARIEVYPNEDASYWYGRAVDATGTIVAVVAEGIRREIVEETAAREWPGVEVFEIPDALTDSLWSESNPAASWNGRHRPSPRRLFGQ